MKQKYEPVIVGETREARARELLKNPHAVKKINDNLYVVWSQTGIGNYRVSLPEGNKEWICNCPDHIKNNVKCKHIYALEFYLEAKLPNKREPMRKRAWKEYNLAQMNEIEKFDELLRELVDTIPDEVQTMGRPKLAIQDQYFCAVQKVYSQLSSRRSQTLLNRAEENDHVEHSPHFNAVSKFLNRDDITPTLIELVRMSASPLADIEHDFAIDSSGFRTTSYSAWCEERHGKTKKNVWLKAHICTGVTTNIVSDVIVTDGNSADINEFPSLFKGTKRTFDMREVSADKGYLSREIYALAKENGVDAYIMFKNNVKGRAKGSPAWLNAFYHFQNKREDFLKHYHKRSNVESTFGAIKMKLGETLKSKNKVAQTNELLCKVLAYNITVLINCMYTRNVNPVFSNTIYGIISVETV